MRREGLRRNLALAISELLRGHRPSFPNVMRYVLPHVNLYSIRRNQVKSQDILVALELVRNAQRQNPIQFIHSIDPLWATKRRDFFLNSPTIFVASTGRIK